MKCILSTGLGRLHLLQSAASLTDIGVDLNVIQGWTPRHSPKLLINMLGKLAGSNNLTAGLAKRNLSCIKKNQLHSCAFSEFFSQSLFMLNRLGLLGRGTAAQLGWASYGRSTRAYLRNADIFHVRSGGGRGGAIARAKRSGMKVIVDHSIAHPAFLERELSKEYDAAAIPFWMGPNDPFWSTVLEDCDEADALLVNSDFVKKTFVENNYPADKIHVVYLGVREDFFGLKQQYGQDSRLELLFTGGFGFRKGAQYLLPALEQLDRDGLDFRLTVVGTTDEARNLLTNTRVAAKLNCVGHVPQDCLKDYLARADIYVFPTLAEGCASSGMEAMAAGLPVITTTESGLPITHGVDGWLVPTKATRDLADAIRKLASDQALREQLGTAASGKIAEGFTWKHYAMGVRDLYAQLLQA